MEVYLKVLEKLEMPNKNNVRYLKLENLTSKNNQVMKLTLSNNAVNQEFVLVKSVLSFDLFLPPNIRRCENVMVPSFSIDHDGARFTVFDGNFIEGYQFQDSFDFDHTVLILETIANFHANYFTESLLMKQENYIVNFFNYFKNCMQKIETNFLGGKINTNLTLVKSQFDKILRNLENTLDKKYWVPSFGGLNKIPVFFKYDEKGKLSDFKILMLNVCTYVPPLYDILILIFSFTNEENRKLYLQEYLKIYYDMLKNKLGNTFFDSEQFNFQIRSFIPLIKLLKFIFYMKEDSTKNGYVDNLQELSEFLHCPNLLREECHEILLNYLGHNNYDLKSFLLTPLQQRYGNLGDYFKFKATVILNFQENDINLFLKFLPSNNESTNAAARSGPSMKEDFFYNFFIKHFQTYGLKDYLNFAPKCFLSKVNYILVLEDLGLQGYRLITEQNHFTYEMLTLTVKKMAQLHACSLVFEEIKSKELQKQFRLDEYYGEYLEEIIFQTKETNLMRVLSEVGEKTVTDYLIYLYPEVAKNMTMEEFQKRAKLTFKNFYSKVLKSNTYRNTLCHGDTWDTNIMFKFDSNNSPVDCKLVDFQMTRYCPPIQDVMSHLYLTTIRETRTKYLTILLNEYYEELSKIVTSFGFDMETVLSAEEFWKSCDYMKSQAVCQTLFYAPTNLSSFEERANVFSDPEKFDSILMKDRRPFIEEMIKKHSFYKARLGEWVQDLYDICENEQY